jgi:hypothetical protein
MQIRALPAPVAYNTNPMQTKILSFDVIDHRSGGNSGRILGRIEDLFARHQEDVGRTKTLAREVAEIVGQLDPVIERHTSSVCPRCTAVCCANRHSYHAHEDVVYLCALGEKIPAYDLHVGDDALCQFMGDRGCSIRRALRPHRCNSYFCTPLLAHMENGSVKEYRGFVETIKKLTEVRMAMLTAFAEASESCIAADYQIDF